jgi:hypothetical protein
VPTELRGVQTSGKNGTHTYRLKAPADTPAKDFWSVIVCSRTEGEISYDHPTCKDYLSHILYYATTTSVENYGAATLYVDCAQDSQGRWLDGGKNHILRIEPNVPARALSVALRAMDDKAAGREFAGNTLAPYVRNVPRKKAT